MGKLGNGLIPGVGVKTCKVERDKRLVPFVLKNLLGFANKGRCVLKTIEENDDNNFVAQRVRSVRCINDAKK